MTEEDLKMQFELTRQSIATWSAETAHFVAQGVRAREAHQSDPQAARAASLTLAAVRNELDNLADASRATHYTDADLLRGVETALAELGSLEKNLSEALNNLGE